MRTFHSLSRPLAENPGRAAKRDPVAIAPFPLGIVLACSLVPGLEHTQFPRCPPALGPCKTIESVSNLPSHRYFHFRPDLLCSSSISYRVNRWLAAAEVASSSFSANTCEYPAKTPSAHSRTRRCPSALPSC